MVPWAVEKLPARSPAASVTEKVPPLAGVAQSSLGVPPSTVALVLQTIFVPCLIVIVTVEIFDSEIFTPARVPPLSLVDRSEITGGVLRSAVKCCAVGQ